MSSPEVEALAFRIWQFAKAREWNCSAVEVAEYLEVSTQRVIALCAARGWNRVMRGDSDNHRKRGNALTFTTTNKGVVGSDLHHIVSQYRALADKFEE